MSRIIVCEKRGDWAGAFRSEGFGNQIVETRHLDDCSASLAQFPGSWTAVEVGPAECLRFADWLTATRQRDWRAAHLVIVDSNHQELAWWLRQLGAVYVLVSRLDLFHAAPMIRRHLARTAVAPLSLQERIWNNLPWSK